jgi:putative transposase
LVECVEDEAIDFKKKCTLLNVSRGSMYYKPKIQENNDAIVINELHEIYQETHSYGYRRMTIALRERGFLINHKRVRALQKIAGIQAIYPQKRTSIKNQAHKVFPYLLRDVVINRPNQVWQVDITYIKIRGGFVYLVCLIDVFSRKIMGWKLSTSLDTISCLDAFNDALKYGIPEIVNSDQGCQFTSEDWITSVQQHGIKISMDGKGRWADNVYIERLWRTIKYEMVHLHSFDMVSQVRDALARYIMFYNTKRYHSKLNYHTPDAIFDKKVIPTKQELFASFTLKPVYQFGTAMI